jgi:hypothetical protein
MNKKIATQSKTPGCTQSINLFKCSDKYGDICVFVDLRKYIRNESSFMLIINYYCIISWIWIR